MNNLQNIKYRGKRCDNGEWVYGFVEFRLVDGDLTKTKYCAFITYDYMDKIGKVYRDRFEVIPETISQYTGLNDKNGVEIYGGDVLYDSDWECTGVVTWSKRHLSWRLCSAKNDYAEFLEEFITDQTAMIAGSSEVISNVIDNPELLEV